MKRNGGRDRSNSVKREQRGNSVKREQRGNSVKREQRSQSRKNERRDRSGSSPNQKQRKNEKRSGSGARATTTMSNPARESENFDDGGVTILDISHDDAAFVLGRGGKTKQKIARVSGAKLDLFEKDKLEIRGTKLQRRRGEKYCKAVMAQRHGVVKITKEDDEGDMTSIFIPHDAVGFVTGRQGNFLRTLEEEWNVLMLFVEFDKNSGKRDEELIIFGDRRGRRGAELKALSAVESKCSGFFESHRDEILYRDQDDDWGVSTMEFKNDELAYALGRGGGTRKKIEASSGCITQYLGHTAVFAGTRDQRSFAKQYVKWLFEQLDGPVYVNDWKERDDCCVLKIPQDCVGYVTGSRRAALGEMEQEWGVLMFFMGSKDEAKKAEELIIFGPERSRKGAQLKVMSTVETKCRGFYTDDVDAKTSSRDGFDVDIEPLDDNEISYALGARGATRKKLELASGAILQYIRCFAFIAGTKKERRRCSDYLSFLLGQRRGRNTDDFEDRDDYLEVHIPRNCVSFITENKGFELRRIEEGTHTFCFLTSKGSDDRVIVLGKDEGDRNDTRGRLGAKRMLEDLQLEVERRDRRRQNYRSRSRERRYDSRSRRGGGRGRSPTPRRYDSRARDRSRGRGRRNDSRDSRR